MPTSRLPALLALTLLTGACSPPPAVPAAEETATATTARPSEHVNAVIAENDGVVATTRRAVVKITAR